MKESFLVEVIKGVAGHCLVVGDEKGGIRIAGPKPMGGGRVVHSFRVSAKDLMRAMGVVSECRNEKL